MSKEKKNFTKLNLKKKNKSPHIFRTFSAARRYLPFGILTGIVILFGINLWAQGTAPQLYRSLLGDVTNPQLLKQAYKSSLNKELNSEIRKLLVEQVGEEEVGVLDAEKDKLQKTYERIQRVVRENPLYPDGYAYLAVLEYRLKKCSSAESHIKKARALDINREELKKLEKQITNSCLPY